MTTTPNYHPTAEWIKDTGSTMRPATWAEVDAIRHAATFEHDGWQPYLREIDGCLCSLSGWEWGGPEGDEPDPIDPETGERRERQFNATLTHVSASDLRAQYEADRPPADPDFDPMTGDWLVGDELSVCPNCGLR